MKSSYQLWKKHDTSKSWHPALQWNPKEPQILEPEENDLWKLDMKKLDDYKNPSNNSRKWKPLRQEIECSTTNSQSSGTHVQKKGKTSEQYISCSEHGPVGFIWDGVNCSCAYDSVFTIFLHIWKTNPTQWSNIF